MTSSDPDDEPDDTRRLAQIRGEDVDVIDDIDRQTDDPRELARLIAAASGTGRTHRR